MSICYIVGAGELYGSFAPCDGDLVIAADGGYDNLMKLGVTPDLVIGDMDSIVSDSAKAERLVYPIKKNETDSFLAYFEGVRRGYSEFLLYGCTGGREDHTYANYSLLVYARNHGHKMTLVGKVCDATAIVNESIELHGTPTSHLSVFAFGGKAQGVSVIGAEYEAENIALSPDFPLGVSNRFLSTPVTVGVKSGALLIMTEK